MVFIIMADFGGRRSLRSICGFTMQLFIYVADCVLSVPESRSLVTIHIYPDFGRTISFIQSAICEVHSVTIVIDARYIFPLFVFFGTAKQQQTHKRDSDK